MANGLLSEREARTGTQSTLDEKIANARKTGTSYLGSNMFLLFKNGLFRCVDRKWNVLAEGPDPVVCCKNAQTNKKE